MSTDFTVTTKTRLDAFKDKVSIGDIATYEFDCTPWQDDNSTITGATWTVESGSASISGQAVSSGIVSAQVSFTQAERVLISILLTTATEKKKLWLEIICRDYQLPIDDYGANV